MARQVAIWNPDAKRSPLEGWGREVRLPAFPRTGVVDLVEDLSAIGSHGTKLDRDYDPNEGVPLELGYITSSPPIVVNCSGPVGARALAALPTGLSLQGAVSFYGAVRRCFGSF